METTSFTLHRFTVDQYHRMIEEGILGEDDRVELVNGILVEMSPHSPAHAETVAILTELLGAAYRGGGHVRAQLPLTAPPRSEPEPDLVVVRGPSLPRRRRHPTGADVLLVVEVAVTSLPDDHIKADVYARAGVPEYWIIDLAGRRVRVHQQLAADTYTLVRLLGEGDDLCPPGLDVRWKIADLLP